MKGGTVALVISLHVSCASAIFGFLFANARQGRSPQVEPRSGFRQTYFTNLTEDMDHFNRALDNILIVRPSGSRGNVKVRKYIADEMRSLGWTVEYDEFNDQTPKGSVKFSNIIATLNPRAPRRLVITAHYDSKLTPKGFLGATDSAVPCAQMLNLARVMRRDLAWHQSKQFQDVTLQFVFFDGEEPFVEWRGNDNTYGSRHLAKLWESDRKLDGIDTFLLLDLLGAKSPRIPSLDTNTHNWYNFLASTERQVIRSFNHLPAQRIFDAASAYNNGVEDDHIPFFHRGVPVLHLIAAPFPSVWHKITDDRSAVDLPTVEKLNKILRSFVADYLRL